jgi:hypothetical protein
MPQRDAQIVNGASIEISFYVGGLLEDALHPAFEVALGAGIAGRGLRQHDGQKFARATRDG